MRIFEYVELWHNCNSVWYEQQDVRAAHMIRTKREHTMSESGTNQLGRTYAEHQVFLKHIQEIKYVLSFKINRLYPLTIYFLSAYNDFTDLMDVATF